MNPYDEMDPINGLEILEGLEEELEGLGRRVFKRPLTTLEKAAITSTANKLANYKIKNSLLTRSQRFLDTKVADMDADSQKLAKAGRLSHRDGMRYIKNKLAYSGITPLYDVTVTKKTPGLCNLEEGGKLGANVNGAYDRIELNYDMNTVDSIVKADYQPIGTGNTDITLQNSEIRIKKNGQVILTRIVGEFNKKAPAQDGEGAANGINLRKPLFFNSTDQIDVEIQTPSGETLATTSGGSTVYHFLEVRFIGSETGLKNNV